MTSVCPPLAARCRGVDLFVSALRSLGSCNNPSHKLLCISNSTTWQIESNVQEVCYAENNVIILQADFEYHQHSFNLRYYMWSNHIWDTVNNHAWYFQYHHLTMMCHCLGHHPSQTLPWPKTFDVCFGCKMDGNWPTGHLSIPAWINIIHKPGSRSLSQVHYNFSAAFYNSRHNFKFWYIGCKIVNWKWKHKRANCLWCHIKISCWYPYCQFYGYQVHWLK